jgi:hypothetical protein
MQTASLLWLAPIAALLYLNFSQYVIGQSSIVDAEDLL